MRASPTWLLVIPLTLLWPVAHLLMIVGRLGRLPQAGLAEGLIFVPMGLLSAIFAIIFWQRAESRRGKIGVLLGYLLLAPAALAGSLFGGLLLPPLAGTLLCGALPLIVGMALGLGAARYVGEG